MKPHMRTPVHLRLPNSASTVAWIDTSYRNVLADKVALLSVSPYRSWFYSIVFNSGTTFAFKGAGIKFLKTPNPTLILMNPLKKQIMNKTITTLLAAVGIAASAPASAVVIGGVDFGTLGGAPFRTHLETATLAQTFINGNGQNATAYGFITTVNGDTSYCADGSSNCGLYYVANF